MGQRRWRAARQDQVSGGAVGGVVQGGEFCHVCEGCVSVEGERDGWDVIM